MCTERNHNGKQKAKKTAAKKTARSIQITKQQKDAHGGCKIQITFYHGPTHKQKTRVKLQVRRQEAYKLQNKLQNSKKMHMVDVRAQKSPWKKGSKNGEKRKRKKTHMVDLREEGGYARQPRPAKKADSNLQKMQ